MRFERQFEVKETRINTVLTEKMLAWIYLCFVEALSF